MTIEYIKVGEDITRKETRPVKVIEYVIVKEAKLKLIDEDIAILQAQLDELNAEKALLTNVKVSTVTVTETNSGSEILQK